MSSCWLLFWNSSIDFFPPTFCIHMYVVFTFSHMSCAASETRIFRSPNTAHSRKHINVVTFHHSGTLKLQTIFVLEGAIPLLIRLHIGIKQEQQHYGWTCGYGMRSSFCLFSWFRKIRGSNESLFFYPWRCWYGGWHVAARLRDMTSQNAALLH